MKKSVIWLLLTGSVLFFGCSKKDTKEQKEAHDSAILCAQKVIENASQPPMVLEGIVLDAKVAQSKFMAENDTSAVNEFDRTFRNYITSHNDSLAKEIF